MERLTNHLTRALLAALVIGALLGILEASLRLNAWYRADCGTGSCAVDAAQAEHPELRDAGWPAQGRSAQVAARRAGDVARRSAMRIHRA